MKSGIDIDDSKPFHRVRAEILDRMLSNLFKGTSVDGCIKCTHLHTFMCSRVIRLNIQRHCKLVETVAKKQNDDVILGSKNLSHGYNYILIPILRVIWLPLPQSGQAEPGIAHCILVMEGGNRIIEIVLESI
jgi:hypothetical protein